MADDSPLKAAVPHYYRDTTGDAAMPGGGEKIRIDTLQTITDIVYRHLPELAPREYVLQKQVRNAYQRGAYENIAFDLSSGDGLSALFQYVKLKLEIAISIQHKTFNVYGVALPEDWEFPPDPYMHAWWRR